mgnify:CR=1 FL=1
MRTTIWLIFALLFLASLVQGVKSTLSQSEFIFNFDSNTGILVVETDTEALLISIEKSDNLKNIIDIYPQHDLIVKKSEPIILKLNIQNPNAEINGFLSINVLYDKLPKNMNYYGDDTIRIPIRISFNEPENTKVYVHITETLLPGEKAKSLSGILLPAAVIVALLFVFKSKWNRIISRHKARERKK